MGWLTLGAYAVGAARREVLELRTHKERAATALAAAQQQITDLTSALAHAGALPDKSHVASTREVRHSASVSCLILYICLRASVNSGV